MNPELGNVLAVITGLLSICLLNLGRVNLDQELIGYAGIIRSDLSELAEVMFTL